VLMYSKAEGKEKNQLLKYSVDGNGKLQITPVGDSPQIHSPELTDIHNQITGGKDLDFVLVGPESSYKHIKKLGDARVMRDAPHFEKVLNEMQTQKNFPAILLVDARKPPFNKHIGADEHTHAWHVINIQSVRKDETTGKLMVEFTNQWGEKANHLGDRAVPAEQLFEATKR
jgi:hypothetical protein